MAQQCSSAKNFNRGVEIIDFILNNKDVTLEDVSKEFELSKTTIRRDINLVGSEAFYGYQDNSKKLQHDYLAVKKILSSNTCATKKN